MRWTSWLFRGGNKDAGAKGQATPTMDREYTQRRLGWLGGRQHMMDAPYLLPTDDQEINRLDFQHYMLRYILRGNYLAPISSPRSILDVGCGTGRWATEMAALFPHTNVIGTDIIAPAPDQPTSGAPRPTAERPDNYAFVPGDVLKGLPFDSGSFDFVHMRLLLFAIPTERWPSVAAELVRVTRPGGWIELVETGPQQGGGPAMGQLVNWISAAMQYRGIDPLVGPRVGDFLRTAGVPQVESQHYTIEVGKHGDRLGAMAETDIFAVMSGVRAPMVASGMVTEPQFNAALETARRDINRQRCTLPFYAFYGQRP